MGRVKYLGTNLLLATFAASFLETNATAEPTKNAQFNAGGVDAIVTLETSAHQAFKAKDAKFWDQFLSDKFVGYGATGRLDKASAKQEFTGADCDVKSFALSDVHTQRLSADAALITYKASDDGTCSGQRLPGSSWEASVYRREGDHWKLAFHAESPVVDPTMPAAKPAASDPALMTRAGEPAASDAHTKALLAVERLVWEYWKDHDATKIANLTADNISFINIFGTYLATKAEALQNWSGNGCNVKRVGISNARSTMLSPTVGILTFTGSADGTCYGQAPGPIWGTSVYVKHGRQWKWTFGINTPAR